MSPAVIEEYSTGGKKLAQMVASLTRDQLLSTPIPGKWSMQVLVIHLADAESAFADRIRRVIAMDNPPLLAWSENDYLKNLHYEDQSVEDAVMLIDLTRRQLGKVLKALPESAFARAGDHSERGRQTLEEVIGFANYHLNHHLKFAAEKRSNLTSTSTIN